jgi:GNAT superfamily N-acetyltransferase
MVIRPIRAEEWETWRELRLRALADSPEGFRETLESEGAQPDDLWEELARRTAEHPDGEMWVAEVDGIAVGQAFSRVREDRSTMGIGAMWVAPEARAHGVGRGLLEGAEVWGRERGCTAASLSVTAGNSAAEELYRSAGYEPTGVCEPLRDGSSLECVQLAKEL